MYDDRGGGREYNLRWRKGKKWKSYGKQREQMEREEKRTTKKEKMQTIEILVIPDEGLKIVRT